LRAFPSTFLAPPHPNEHGYAKVVYVCKQGRWSTHRQTVHQEKQIGTEPEKGINRVEQVRIWQDLIALGFKSTFQFIFLIFKRN